MTNYHWYFLYTLNTLHTPTIVGYIYVCRAAADNDNGFDERELLPFPLPLWK